MRFIPALSVPLLSTCIALSLAQARADDPSSPPAPPAAPAGVTTSPSDVGPPPPARSGRRRAFVLAELTAKLGLTAEQQKTVAGILAVSASQVKELRGDDTLSKVDKRARRKLIGDLTRAQIRAALTPDQMKIFDSLPANSRRSGPEQPAPPAPPAS